MEKPKEPLTNNVQLQALRQEYNTLLKMQELAWELPFEHDDILKAIQARTEELYLRLKKYEWNYYLENCLIN